ncbi:hypothetical protein ASPTUDRAFT_39367 [Aspergillus tubingensis CBS 134.48]|uniref:Uncharacterized protein n=1 Tax=Aspergillus tubingensis (strain CBS 134.48) TaxID=767770 RepID=A0A1L9NB04_ASPTC|nr:hypothetical protein ASPTUDRAFT_39367 [Aspergillus tubingensis CBS 134.48]
MPRLIDRAQPSTCPKKNGLLRTFTNTTIYLCESYPSRPRSVNPSPLPEPRISHDPGLKPQRRVSVQNVMQHTDQPFVFPKQVMQVI